MTEEERDELLRAKWMGSDVGRVMVTDAGFTPTFNFAELKPGEYKLVAVPVPRGKPDPILRAELKAIMDKGMSIGMTKFKLELRAALDRAKERRQQ